jgi:hypothetical protein
LYANRVGQPQSGDYMALIGLTEITEMWPCGGWAGEEPGCIGHAGQDHCAILFRQAAYPRLQRHQFRWFLGVEYQNLVFRNALPDTGLG